jgi:sodium transport system permease protein
MEALVSRLSVWGELPPELMVKFEKNREFSLVPLRAPVGLTKELAKPDAKTALEQAQTELIILVSPQFMTLLRDNGQGDLIIFYDKSNSASQEAFQRTESILLNYRQQVLHDRLTRLNLSEDFVKPLEFHNENIASAKKMAGYTAGQIIPFILIIMVMLGSFYPSIELTAGEKERNTMPTLLCAPLHPYEIIAGKFLAVWSISMITALANLISMSLAFGHSTFLLEAYGGGNFSLGLPTFMIIFLLLIPTAFLFSAVMLTVAVFARSFKEAQNYLTPVYLVMILPGIFSSMPGIHLNMLLTFVPVVNITLLIKEMLQSEFRPEMIFLVLMATLMYSVMILCLATRIFTNESVVLGGKLNLSEMLSLHRPVGEKRLTLSPEGALFLATCLLVLVYYLGSLASIFSNSFSIIVIQWLLIALPTILVIWFFQLDYRAVLRLNRPTWSAGLGALFIGLSLWLIASFYLMKLQHIILPDGAGFAKLMAEYFQLERSRVPIPIFLLLYALSPAICEELLFRGLILSSLQSRWRPWSALLVSALIFGFFHMSVYRLLPTMFLGFVIAWTVMRSDSIFCGMLIHAMTNTIFLLDFGGTSIPMWLGMSERGDFPGGMILGGSGLFLLGLGLLARKPREETISSSLARP